MRILIHSRTYLPRIGGVEQMTFLLARELASRGHDVVVATDVAEESSEDATGGFRVARANGVLTQVKLARWSNVVHSSGHSMVAIAIAKAARRPLVVTHHGYQATCLSGLGWHGGRACGYNLAPCVWLTYRHEGAARTLRQLARHVVARPTLGLASRHVAVSQFVASKLRIPHTDVVSNAVDNTVFNSGPSAGSRDAFLFVGRLVAEKGTAGLLTAFARYRELGGRRSLEVVGGGPEEGRLRGLAATLGIEKDVRFRGPLRGPALASVYRECLATLVPSVWDEAFGIVAAEAACCGRVALVARSGGLPEVAVKWEATVPVGETEAWASAMRRIDSDDDWRVALEARLPLTAKRYAPALMADSYLSIYSAALNCTGVCQ